MSDWRPDGGTDRVQGSPGADQPQPPGPPNGYSAQPYGAAPSYDPPPQYDYPQLAQYGNPEYGQPQYGQSQYGQSQYGPEYGQSGHYPQAQYGQPQYDQPQYGQPGQYGQPQYGQPGQYGQPQFPPAVGYQYPYPPQGGPYGYPPVRSADARPGNTTTATVLGYVAGGLLIFAALLLFTGASFIESVNSNYDPADTHVGEFVVAGLVNLVAAALLIAGSVSLGGRHPGGRLIYTVGAGIVVAATVYWLVRWGTNTGDGPAIFYGLIFAALVIVGTAMAWTGATSRWLRSA